MSKIQSSNWENVAPISKNGTDWQECEHQIRSFLTPQALMVVKLKREKVVRDGGNVGHKRKLECGKMKFSGGMAGKSKEMVRF